jgi:hypothetical protein
MEIKPRDEFRVWSGTLASATVYRLLGNPPKADE